MTMTAKAIINISQLPQGAIARIVRASNYSRKHVYRVLNGETELGEDNEIILDLAKEEIENRKRLEKKKAKIRKATKKAA